MTLVTDLVTTWLQGNLSLTRLHLGHALSLGGKATQPAPMAPFIPEVPTEALYVPPKLENFCWRIEQAHLREGGFALIHGDPGSGKSVVMRVLAERLARLADLSVGVIYHPQSSLSDFYRELGDIFSISIRVSNRWGGRVFTTMAGELLLSAAQRDLPVLDEKLYLQVFARPDTPSTRRAAARCVECSP